MIPRMGGVVRQGLGFSSAPVELLNLLQVTEHGNIAKADRKIIYSEGNSGKVPSETWRLAGYFISVEKFKASYFKKLHCLQNCLKFNFLNSVCY